MSFDTEKIRSVNIDLLRSKGIDTPEHLPYLDQPRFRSPKSVAERCLVLVALLQLHFEFPRDHLVQWLDDNNLTALVTKEESLLLETDFVDLPKQTQIDVYWFIEAIWAFAWAGGLHPNLTLNTPVEDSLAAMFPSAERLESTAEFVARFRLRDKEEIVTKLDLLYRAHWFTRNSRSDLVDMDLIMERRKALEWLCDISLNWDYVPLDT